MEENKVRLAKLEQSDREKAQTHCKTKLSTDYVIEFFTYKKIHVDPRRLDYLYK